MTIEYRLAHYSSTAKDMVDCEINHPDFGWIPTSFPVDGSDSLTADLCALVLSENTDAELNRIVDNGVLRERTAQEWTDELTAKLDTERAFKVIELEKEAYFQITKGFDSATLGSTHTYGSKETDQLNLIGALSTEATMPYPCADSEGVWDRRSHTHSQLVQVATDGAARKQAVLVYLDTLRTAVAAATTSEGIQGVVWDEADYVS